MANLIENNEAGSSIRAKLNAMFDLAKNAILTTLALGGATLGSKVLAVTGDSQFNGDVAAGSVTGGSVQAAGNSILGFVARICWTSVADGITTLYTNGFGVPTRMNFGGNTASQSSFQFSGVDIKVGLADGTAGGRFFTTGGVVRKVRVVTAAGAVTVATTDDVVSVNKTTGAATTVNLPATPTTGQTYVIKDGKGDAATNNITVTPAAGNIDGAATYVMTGNYQAVTLTYTGSEWSVI